MKYTLKIDGNYMEELAGAELYFSDLNKLFDVIKSIENNSLCHCYYEIYPTNKTEGN